jgi:anti-sigma regulatory factor (Ser/Thr protein kinase)
MNEPEYRRRQSILLPKDVPAARTARSALDEWLAGTDRPTADAAKSIVTELVSNAVAYGRPPIQVTVEQQPACVRIEVADAGTGTPVRRPPDEHGGWGLEIVRKLAPRYGLLTGRPGVWCELRSHPAVRPAAGAAPDGS